VSVPASSVIITLSPLYKKESLDAKYLRAVDVDPQIGEHASGLKLVTSDGGVIEHDSNSNYNSSEEPDSTGSKC
jgi:hypothetical protein